MSLWRAAAVYSVAAVVLTFPLAFSLTSRLGALQGEGDPYLNLWILGWGLQAWTTDPLSVFTGSVFDANIFFPAEGALTYSDHFLLQALALAPVYALTGNAVLCYNLLLLASIAFSGLAMHGLVRGVTGSTAGAFVAGLAWACWPYRTAHLLHIQLQALYFMPLALLFLHRVMAGRRWREAVALGALAALQFIASVYYGLMTAIVLVVAGVALAVTTGQWRSRRLWVRLAAGGALAGALSLPLVVPYVRTQQSDGFGRTLFEAANHSASLQAYTQVAPQNLVYGTSGLLAPRAPAPGARDRTHVEHQLFPGLVLLALAIWGAVRHVRSDARPLVWSAAALTLVGVVLSLGPEGSRSVYAALHENVYGFQAVRAPARFTVIAMLGLCLLAALGMRDVALRRRGLLAGVIPAAVLGLLALEYVNAPLPLAAAPPLRTAVGQWLAHEPTPGAVVVLPLTIDIGNTPVMVQSLEHRRPIVNGYSGQRPAFYSALVESVADLPSPDAFAALREIDVRFVVSPQPLAGAGHPRSPLVERARVAGGVIYELRWTSEALAALDDTAAPAPPPPGPVPFSAGEQIAFDVYWDSGPLDVPAGTATLTARPTAGEGWEFEAFAQTADWVSTFFEARDRLTTTADAQLLPLEHRRELREGRRSVDRVYTYERASNLVHTGTMSLPLGHHQARDALTALYYVRTLPLASGDIFTVPLNEAGNRLVLQVAVGGEERIDVAGQPVTALRLAPRVMRRIERRRPLAITLWVSADARREPLRAIVDAGFGTIRLERRR